MATLGRAGPAVRAHNRAAASGLAHTNDPVLTAEGQEAALATAVVADNTGVVLICWEHQHIPAIAAALPTVSGTQIPAAWPGNRFDLLWSFSLEAGASSTACVFS